MEIKIWTDDWNQYELLDSGDYMRLERFKDMTIARSEPRAWWSPELPRTEWDKAVAVYDKEENGQWAFRKNAPHELVLPFEDIKAKIKFTNASKHVGVFPEQSGQWRLISEKIRQRKGKETGVLNLFGYTGMGTLAAAAAGASVTHVDGSKPAITWANENQDLSGLGFRHVRWMLDDAYKFAKREVRRGKKYEGIILDPPAFGRGPKGQVWKVEDHLVSLLNECRQLLSDDPLFVILTMYSVDSSSLSIANLLEDMTKGLGGKVQAGELVLKPKKSGKVLPVSICSIWQK
ncbi:MAG: class I SAM-dependent methyltransferase [Candidatus Saccharibacteria bacterium]